MFQKTFDQDFYGALDDLKIKLGSDPVDEEQMKLILIQILGFPNLSQAYEHHRANILGINDLLSKQIEIERKVEQKDTDGIYICGCCGLLLQNDELPLGTNLNEINLGIGIMLFFQDILYHSGVYFVLFFLYSIFAISTNSKGFHENSKTEDQLCQNWKCGFSHIGAGSKVLEQDSIKNAMSLIQAWIGVAMVVIWGISNMIKTYYQQRIIACVQTKRVSASDFTLMIKKFPREHLGGSYEESLMKIRKIFSQYEQNEKTKRECSYPFEVVSINIAKNLFEYKQRNRQKKMRMKQQLYRRQTTFRNWVYYYKKYKRFPLNYQERQKRYQEYISYYAQTFENDQKEQIDVSGYNIVFVTFRHSKAREQIQKHNEPVSMLKFWSAFRDSQFPISKVKITKAPDPQEIKWNNVGFPKSERFFRRFIVWLAAIVMIGASLAINIGISYIKQKSLVVSFSISIVVTLINLGMQVSIVHFSFLEREYISSLQQSSIAMKIALAQLINSIAVPMVVAAISNKSWFRVNGLVDDVFFIALLNLLVPISFLIDPYEIVLKVVRWWVSDPERRLEIFGQPKFNRFFGNYIFDIGYEYAFVIKTSIFTAFFLPMQPIIALFAPFALLFFYIANKRNLFYHYKRPGYHFQTTNNIVDTFLLFSPLAFGLGSLLVNNFNNEVNEANVSNGTLQVNILNTFIAFGLGIMVPFRVFYCCVSKPEIENKDYYAKKMLIYTDYDRSNPLTKDIAIEQFQIYIRDVERRQGLSPEAQMVKLFVSTAQKLSVIKPDNSVFIQSVSRISAIRQSSIQPAIHLEPQFYGQMPNCHSTYFGRRSLDLSLSNSKEHQETNHHLAPLQKITQNRNQESEFNLPGESLLKPQQLDNFQPSSVIIEEQSPNKSDFVLEESTLRHLEGQKE